MPKRAIIFGKAFQYEPSTGDLSTVPEFGGISNGQLDKYLSQTEVQAAIRELGEVLEQQTRGASGDCEVMKMVRLLYEV
jgi:hypothetical protein